MNAIFRTIIAPSILVLLCPQIVGVIWFTHTKLDGSIANLVRLLASEGFVSTTRQVWQPIFFGSPAAWAIIAIFAGVELVFMRLIPARRSAGPISPAGQIPVYKANGVPAFAATLVLFAACSFGLRLFPATTIYDHFGEILGALNIFSLTLCIVLYFKGLYAPSSPDNGSSGNFIFDFFWGTELYPRVFGWDVKMFINCRFAMMGWPLALMSFAAKQYEIYGQISDAMTVAVALQILYVAKFFWWEAGYLRSLDIMHDRAGFYLCWGCMVWLPAIYASSTLYLVKHPNHLGLPLATAILLIGSAAIVVNYLADAQRQTARGEPGKTRIWGKEPVLVYARYTTSTGETKTNPLLASGWWGVARHFHYVPEIVAAFCWTLPVLFDNTLPYFYVIFLMILLVDRAVRDERRCAAKYGSDWTVYCQRVPYMIVPGVL